MSSEITIIGAGLAGSEAAYQAAKRGLAVRLIEMRPNKMTPAHKTGFAGELVCSNSLGASDIATSKGLLQYELRALDSLIMQAADAMRTPAGGALAVDREKFAEYIEERISRIDSITIERAEVVELPPGPLIIAAGPLVSPALAETLGRLIGEQFLHFVDAISPIIDADSIDYDIVFAANRYGKGGGADYLNCPLDEAQYNRLVDAIITAEKVPPHEFENEKKLYEACMPIEELAARGRKTLAFGPCKPVGLEDAETGKRHFAVVQLRRDNIEGTSYNIVGFQTKMTYAAQRETFRLIPGLENAEFLRLGSVHRNTYINAPELVDQYLRLKSAPRITFAGQIAGAEGYLESTALGAYAGINAAFFAAGDRPPPLPAPETAIGAIIHALYAGEAKRFNPVGMQFGLFKPPTQRMSKKDRKKYYSDRAVLEIEKYCSEVL